MTEVKSNIYQTFWVLVAFIELIKPVWTCSNGWKCAHQSSKKMCSSIEYDVAHWYYLHRLGAVICLTCIICFWFHSPYHRNKTDIFAFGQDSNGYFKNNKVRKQFIGVYSVAYLWNHSMPLKRENRFDCWMKCLKHTKKINKEYTKKAKQFAENETTTVSNVRLTCLYVQSYHV